MIMVSKLKKGFFNTKQLLIIGLLCVVFVSSWPWAPPQAHASISYATSFGSKGTGAGDFNDPLFIALNATGHVFVSDILNNVVNVYSSTGTYLGQIGTGASSGAADRYGAGVYYNPTGVAVNDTGYIYVQDSYLGRVIIFDPSGNYVSEWNETTTGAAQGSIYRSFGIAINSTGYVYTVSSTGPYVYTYTASGTYVRRWGGITRTLFQAPNGIAIDSSGRVYIPDSHYSKTNDWVAVFTAGGAPLGHFGGTGTGSGQFKNPMCVTIDGNGYIYVTDIGTADTSNATERVTVFDKNWNYVTTFGSYGFGPGQFNFNNLNGVNNAYPVGVAVNSATGTIYVVDNGNYRIDMFNNVLSPATTSVQTCNGDGIAQTIFSAGDTMYLSASGLIPATSYNVYIVPHQSSWTFGMAIPTAVSTGTVTSDGSGYLAATTIYDTVAGGSYDVLVTPSSQTGNTYEAQDLLINDVTVNTPLTVKVSPASWTLDVGQSETFTATASGGSGSYVSYQWYVDGIVKSGETSSTFTYSPSTSGSPSITVTVTDSSGATSEQSTAPVITVNSALTAPSIYPSSGTIDQGQTCSLTSSEVSTGTAPYVYQWFKKAPSGNYVKVGANSPSFDFTTSSGTAAGTWRFILQVTDDTGASMNSTAASVTLNVAPFVSITSNSTVVDVGRAVTFTATPAGGSGTYSSYQWYINGLAQNGQTVSTFIFTPNSTGSLLTTATVTDSLGSTSPKSTAFSVTVNSALFAPTVSASAATVAQMQISSLTSTNMSTGTSPYQYQWFSKAPDASSYSLITGANNSKYDFVASTSLATGSWNFVLQVTDGTGVAVNSTVVSVTVNAPASTSSSSSSNRGSSSTATPTPTPTPTPSQNPNTNTTMTITTDTGKTVNIGISGNITSTQMSNVTIATNQTTGTTVISFTVTGQSGTAGYGNITIPKSAVPYGTTPLVYIDGQAAENQSYTQDADNYYAYYTTSFSTHQVKIEFTQKEEAATSLWLVLAFVVAFAAVILVAVTVTLRRNKKSRTQ